MIYQSCDARKSRIAAERSAAAAELSAAEAARLNALTIQSLEIAQTATSAANRSAAATEQQAIAAQSQATLAKGANELTAESLRARVTVRGVTLRKALTAGEPLASETHIENTGHSEAVNVRVRARMIAGLSELPRGAMPELPAPATPSVAVLAPGGKAASDAIMSARGITQPLVAAITEGRARFLMSSALSVTKLSGADIKRRDLCINLIQRGRRIRSRVRSGTMQGSYLRKSRLREEVGDERRA